MTNLHLRVVTCSPESGLLSDWSKNKRSFRATHRLVTSNISDLRCSYLKYLTPLHNKNHEMIGEFIKQQA